MKTKICSAWGDSYYRTFDGRDFVLQGNCNYTLVQTACPGLNASVPLQINIARAYLNSATVSTIHMVQMSIQGFNISIVKEEKNHVRVSVLNLFKLNIHFVSFKHSCTFSVSSWIKIHRLMDRRGTCRSPWEMGSCTCIQVVPALSYTLPLAWLCSMTGSTISRLKFP